VGLHARPRNRVRGAESDDTLHVVLPLQTPRLAMIMDKHHELPTDGGKMPVFD
jgi:hypothetical protein